MPREDTLRKVLNEIANKNQYKSWKEMVEDNEKSCLSFYLEDIERAVVFAREDLETLDCRLNYYKRCLRLQEKINIKNRNLIKKLEKQLKKEQDAEK